MARKHKHPEHVNHERWLVSYADFITLLFATFTMLFAISNVEKAKLSAAAHSISQAFGGKSVGAKTIIAPTISTSGVPETGSKFVISIAPGAPKQGSGRKGDDEDSNGGTGDQEGDGKGEGTPDSKSGGDGKGSAAQPTPTPAGGGAKTLGTSEGGGDAAMAAKLESMIETLGLKGKIDVREETRGTVISLGDAAFFNQGDTAVKPTSVYQLDKVVNALRDQHFTIRVEGHTDNTPIGSGRYKSNLELSTFRASNIVDFMIKQYNYPPELVSCAGYGDTKPVADNATLEGRQKNRRVDIVILNQSMKAEEPKASKPKVMPN